MALPFILAGMGVRLGLGRLATHLGTKQVVRTGATQIAKHAPKQRLKSLHTQQDKLFTQHKRLIARHDAALKAGRTDEAKHLATRLSHMEKRRDHLGDRVWHAERARPPAPAAPKAASGASAPIGGPIGTPVGATGAQAGAAGTEAGASVTWQKVRDLAGKAQSPVLWGLTGASVASMFAGGGPANSGAELGAGAGLPAGFDPTRVAMQPSGWPGTGAPLPEPNLQALMGIQSSGAAGYLGQLQSVGFHPFDPSLAEGASALGMPLRPMNLQTLVGLLGPGILPISARLDGNGVQHAAW